MANTNKNTAMAGLVSGLVTHAAYSDLTVECDGRQWAAHKIVVCLQSNYFKKACDAAFTQGTDMRIALQEDSHEVVNAVIQFLYTQDYHSPTPTGVYDRMAPLGNDASALHFHFLVRTAADKYELPALQDLSEVRFKLCATAAPLSLVETTWLWIMGTKLDHLKIFAIVEMLQKVGLESLDFAHMVQQIWSLVPAVESLKVLVKDMILANPSVLGEDGNLALKDDMRTRPGLAADLCFWMVPQPLANVQFYECYECEQYNWLEKNRELQDMVIYDCSNCGKGARGVDWKEKVVSPPPKIQFYQPAF